VGRFLGELKEYDHRNTVHSTYMRLKVRINVTNPLQKSWKVRANEGNFVEILFKYEKLGIFCFLCGVLGHTDKDCTKLFDMEQDDGVREWGDNIRPIIKRMGTAATNKYLQDPIPSRSQFVTGSGSGTQGVSSHDTTNSHPTPAASNLDGRLVAVQREISAIKSGILTAQKQALAKSGRNLFGVGPSHIPLVSTDSSSLAVSNMSQSQPVVMGLLAEPTIQPQGDNILCLEAAESVEVGVDLKKRKRAKADSQEAASVTIGVEGTVGTSIGIGVNDVISFHDNPMYDETVVTAGPEVQACRES
jgi:hypothetical protein